MGLLFLGWTATIARGQCTSNAECDDGAFCTTDICFNPGPGGTCIPVENSCSDGQFCNGAEACDEDRDVCEFACVGGASCSGGFCVCGPGGCPGGNEGAACDEAVQPVSCSPGLVCNEALDACTECTMNAHCTTPPETRCNTGTGQCVQCLTNSHCFDALYCNGEETCDTSSGTCLDGQDVSCPLGQFCSEGLDRCVECENDTQCDDGLYCNGPESCVGDMCQSGEPVNCLAMDPTKLFCSESADQCVACLVDQHCDDGKMCTADRCAEGECENMPAPGQFCDDGVFCNGSEQCNANNTGCVPGVPPPCAKTCFQGVTPGALCSSDGQCGKACSQGARAGQSCGADADCGKACAGGTNNGDACADDEECDSRNCTSRGLCVTGLCRGGCSEAFDQCVQCAPDVAGSMSCSDGLFCDGTETCNTAHQCVPGTRELCESLNSECRKGLCNETVDACGPVDRTDGTACDDDDYCTRVDECSAGACVEEVPASNDPYRCIRLQLVPEVPGNLGAGSTARVKLMAYADNCNVVSTTCPNNSPPITGIEAFLAWDPAKLELQTSTISNLNPEDPCASNNGCFVCPSGQYNWANSFWQNDCLFDAVNGPCACYQGGRAGQPCDTDEFCETTSDPFVQDFCMLPGGPSGTPGNDGGAKYVALSQSASCNGVSNPACVPPTGLHVTTLKFRAMESAVGSSATVDFMPCTGPQKLTAVISHVNPPPGYASLDVTKSLITTATYNIVACTSSAACNDGNPCTTDSCAGGTCHNVPKNCGDADLCTTDTCNVADGSCANTPIDCGSGNRCYLGSCYQVCAADPDCDDAVDCTVDDCVDVNGDDICNHSADNALCATGLFCSARRCEPALGCVFDHSCTSATGNPCPDNAACDESLDNCGGCASPQVTASGCRHLRVSPAPQGETPVAILVEGDCLDSNVACISKYVQSRCGGGFNDGQTCVSNADCPKSCSGGPNAGAACTQNLQCGGGGTCLGTCQKGRLGDSPDFLLASQWGVVQVTGVEIAPGRRYHLMADCDFAGARVLSAAATVTPRIWGDTDGDGSVNVLDVSASVNAVKELWGQATFEGCNIWPCDVDAQVNVLDVASVVDVLKGATYPCAAFCP